MKFKADAQIATSDFFYDLTDGGYIKPEELLENADEARAVNDAINLLLKFRNDAEATGVLEYL